MLIQIVPQRTRVPNGVADYASALAGALRDHGDIGSAFLSAAPLAYALPETDEWKTVCLPQRKAHLLADAIFSLSTEVKARAVLLHFSGYGYQKRGVPLWLPHGLRIWRKRAVHIPLITIFHELYATSRPWSSAFWLSPIQKQIARDILSLSSAAVTPTNLVRRRLSDWANVRGGTAVAAMPVFSNVGEPGRGTAPSAREATAVVFGLAGVEDHLFGIHRLDIERIVTMMKVEKIIDIGPRFFSVPTRLAGVPIISKGALSSGAVSNLLQQARFGFIAYPLDAISKSGVFAAYAAHGVVPIVLSDISRLDSLDGLRPNQHFLDGLRLGANVDDDDLDLIQRELFVWYESHTLKVQADFLKTLMVSSCPQPGLQTSCRGPFPRPLSPQIFG